VHRLGGRFGRGRLVDHLLGKTKDVRPEEATLSTFGVGKEMSEGAWRGLIDQLLFEGLLAETPNDGRPLITLADPEAVRAVYRGERRLTVLKAPASSPAAEAPASRRRKEGPDDLTPEAQGLFEALRAWRREEAARQHLPPYFIFSNDTLAQIARMRPASLADLLGVEGVGQGKLERYGEAVIGVVGGGAAR
jgi:ATP-dependent DNA helicase RecQ